MRPRSPRMPNADVGTPFTAMARVQSARVADATALSPTIAVRSRGATGAGPAATMKSQTTPERTGFAAASSIPARNVKQATTPSTPTMAPTSADRTGTARRPRPGSTARREPISIAGGSPAFVAHRAAADVVGRSRSPRVTRHHAATPATTKIARPSSEHRQAEDEPVGMHAEVELESTPDPDREAGRQRDRDARPW